MTDRVFSVTPKWKKSLVETLNFVNTDTDQRVGVSTLWREGNIVVVVEEGEEVPDWETLESFNPTDKFIYTIDYTWDGVSEDIFSDDLSDEELEELKELWYEDGFSGFEDAGWYEDDPSIVFECPIEVEEITDPEQLKYYI